MTDTLARMRQLIGAPADWAANDLVLAPGELALEARSAGASRLKAGDGVKRFSQLPTIANASLADVVSVYDYIRDDLGLTDETANLNTFFAEAAGKIADIGDTGIFLFTTLIIPANTTLRGRASLACTGTLTGSPISVQITAPFVAEALTITTPGTDSNLHLLQIDGDFLRIGDLVLYSAVERAGLGGAVITGSNIRIDRFRSRRVARPLQFQRTVGTAVQSEIAIGSVDISGYIRGLAFTNCEQFSVGRYVIRGRDTRTFISPGYNGVLISTCRNWSMGPGRIEDSGEHGFRIGGSSAPWSGNTTDFVLGALQIARTGGCGLKLNPGDGQRIMRGRVDAVVGVDVGLGSTNGNTELVRITRSTDIEIGAIYAMADAYAQSCKAALTVNEITRLYVGHVVAANCSGRIVMIDETQEPSAAPGNLSGFYVDRIIGSVQAGTLAAFSITYSSGGRTIGDVIWQGIDVTGFATRLLDASAALTLTGAIEIRGIARGTVPPTTNIQADARIRYGLQYLGSTFAGPMLYGMGSLYSQAVDSPSFDINAGVGTNWGTYFAMAASGVAGAGAYGGAYTFSRVGSNRRGAAIAAKQMTTDDKKVGLSFMVQSNATTANEAVQEKMVLKETGVLNLVTPRVYADNATAVAGGLVSGDFYRTATGEVRMVL